MMLKFREVSGKGRKMPGTGQKMPVKGHFRRLLCVFLSLCILLSPVCFAACGEQPMPSGTPDGSKPSNASSGTSSSGAGDPGDPDIPGGESPVTFVYRSPEETLAALPDYAMDGALVIAVDERCTELLGAHPMLSSSFEGVKNAIKVRYGAEGFFQPYSGEEMLAKSREAVKAEGGEFFADILAIPLSELPRYLAEDLLMPMNQLGGLSFLSAENADGEDGAKAGIFIDSTRALAVDGQCYGLLGSGALSQMGSICLLFNHTLLDELLPAEASLYDAVKTGEWTWERMLSLLGAAADALAPDMDSGENPSAVSSAPADAAVQDEKSISLFGSTISMDSLTAAVSGSLGESPSDGSAESGASPIAPGILSALQELSLSPLQGSDAEKAFREGELLFLVTTADALYDYPNSDGSWGCLPLPKGEEGSSAYLSVLDPDSTCVYVVLKNSLREETKGGYLLALHAAAQYACLPAFRSELLANFIREEESLAMLPYILAGR